MIRTKWFVSGDVLDDPNMIREKVFGEELKALKNIEMDKVDFGATHVVVYDNITPVATGRMIVENDVVKFSRIAVLKEFRGNKYGDLVMRMLIRKAFTEGFSKQYIHSRIGVVGFYEKLGFVVSDYDCFEKDSDYICMCHIGDVSGKCM